MFVNEHVYWICAGPLLLIATALILFKEGILRFFYGIAQKVLGVSCKYSFFVGGIENLHGLLVSITGRTTVPFEITGVSLRINGIDLSKKFMEGWSSVKQPPFADNHLDHAKIDLRMGMIHNGKIIFNANKTSGFKLKKKQKFEFFIPISHEMGMLRYTVPSTISVVIHTPQKDIIIAKGKRLALLVQDILKNYGMLGIGHFEFGVNVMTLLSQLPDTSAVGKLNDQTISL